MDAQGLIQNRHFSRAVILMLVLLVAIFSTEILTSHIPDAPLLTSDTASVVCAAVASILLVRAWRRMDEAEASKKIWGLITLGIVLWTLAEAIWGFYELVLKIEIPYPSFADLLWLGGYIPLYAALIMRYRSFESSASALQKRVVWGFMLLYSAVLVYYVIRPLVESFDSSLLAESLTNMAYPLADWGLCLLTLSIIFSLERGRFASVWHLFGMGILLAATADLIYFYVAWNDLYYPDGLLNWPSGLIDGIFNVSYLALGLSVYAYGILSEAARVPAIQLVLTPAARMEVLVFINPSGQIISVSDNFLNLMRAASRKPFIGMELAPALGLRDPEGGELTLKLLKRDPLSSLPLHVTDSKGRLKTAWITSLPIPTMKNEESQVNSLALLLRCEPPGEGEAEYPLHEDQRMLIDFYAPKVAAGRYEEDEQLRRYFLEQINLLYSIVQQYSGSKVAEKMLEQLGQTARFNNWQFSHSGGAIHFPEETGGQALRNLLVPLLEDARDFTEDVTNRRMVEQEMRTLDKNLSEAALAVLDKYDFHLAPRASVKSTEVAPALA